MSFPLAHLLACVLRQPTSASLLISPVWVRWIWLESFVIEAHSSKYVLSVQLEVRSSSGTLLTSDSDTAPRSFWLTLSSHNLWCYEAFPSTIRESSGACRARYGSDTTRGYRTCLGRVRPERTLRFTPPARHHGSYDSTTRFRPRSSADSDKYSGKERSRDDHAYPKRGGNYHSHQDL